MSYGDVCLQLLVIVITEICGIRFIWRCLFTASGDCDHGDMLYIGSYGDVCLQHLVIVITVICAI